MKNSLKLSGRALLAYLLFVMLSALAILSLAQGNQDQDQPKAAINLKANYNAEAKTWDKDMSCEDQLIITYGGAATYKLLPAGYGTSNVHPEILTTHAALGVDAERTGGFTLNVQGGGNCVPTGKGSNPGKLVWTYKTLSSQVAPKDWPAVSVRLRAGDYSVSEGADPYSAVTCEGQMIVAGAPPIPNVGCPGPAAVILTMLQQQSIQKVSDALSGKIEPYSKQFSRSNSVGDSVSVNESNRTGSASMNISYSLTVGAPEEVEAIIIPQPDGKPPYEEWVPEGGPDEDTPGNTITFKVKLQKKGQPNSIPAQKAQFEFELENVSHEPGVCLNWPPKSQVKDPADFDLRIVMPNSRNPQNLQNTLLESVGKNGQSATSRPKLSEADLTLTSYDYGAYGKLKITVQLQDGSPPFDAHLEGKPDVTEVAIPLDNNGNHIADAWEKSFYLSNTSETADDDSDPQGDGTPGDGLSLYEEYRGFMVKGQHIRTRPDEKDIFICDQNGLGTGLFYLSGLTIHLVDLTEFDTEVDSETPNEFVINFNHGTAHLGQQHVLYMMQGSAGDGNEGRNWTAGQGPGPPKHVQFISVDVESIRDGEENDQDFQAHLDSTIAHELAHGTNVFHHGDDNYSICGEAGQKCSLQHWDGNGWVPVGVGSDSGQTIVVTGGQNSGEQDCIMRYTGGSYYEARHGGEYRWQKRTGKVLTTVTGYDYGDPEKDGTIFCDDNIGTGVNAPDFRPAPKAGAASRGNCKRQFCVNDIKECTKPPEASPQPNQPPVNTGSLTALSSSFNPSGSGQPVSFTATVRSVNSVGRPAGTVTFNDGNTTLDTETLAPNGQATYTTTALGIGTHMMTASYAGNADFLPSTSPVLTQVVSAISLTPINLAFGAQSVGSRSAPQTVTVTNHGNMPVDLSSVKIVGANQTSFGITSTTCGTTVPPNLSCTIALTFAPRARGQQAAALAISDSAGGSPQQVSLSGTAE